MRAGALTLERPFVPQPGAAKPPTPAHVAMVWALLVLVVLAIATVTAAIAPSILDGPTHSLPDEPLLIATIFLNNLLLAVAPVLGGWLARGRRVMASTHPRLWRNVLLGIPVALIAKSLLLVGLVGGSDPAWLLDAARWWLLELAALATGLSGGLWLERHPGVSVSEQRRVVGGTLAALTVALAVAALIEVLTA